MPFLLELIEWNAQNVGAQARSTEISTVKLGAYQADGAHGLNGIGEGFDPRRLAGPFFTPLNKKTVLL